MMNLGLALVLIFNSINFSYILAFTCQGGSYSAATAACPDQGVQLMSMGGNLTITVQYGKNLPNEDASPPTSKLENPYVRFSVGSISSRTNSVPSSSKPNWQQDLSLGFLGSGTILTVELWNAYSGVLFTDKLVASTTFNVPFCSYFYGNDSTVSSCDSDPFSCKADDSAWQMPTRKICKEEGWISFAADKTCNSGSCIYITTTIVPFQMDVEYSYSNALASTPVLSVAGKQTAQALWTYTYNYGLPFIGSTNAIDTTQTSFRNLKGALMWRIRNSEKSYGATGAIKFYAGLNFAATLYVCRYEGDNGNGVPSWITSEYSSLYTTSRKVTLSGSGNAFACYYKSVPATTKNQWGGVESDPIAFRTNTLPGYDTNSASNQALYSYMYIILAIPNVDATRGDDLVLSYDAAQFLALFGSYGLICLWFTFLVFNFLKKIDYRVDRLSSYLVSRVLTGKDRNLLATLFMNKNQSPCNIEFRAHLFHGLIAIYTCLTLPFFLFIAWGMSCAMTVRPRALGVGLTFVGWAALLGYFGYRLWEKNNWRLSSLSLTAVLMAVSFFLLFLLISLFLDPAVLQLGSSVNFVGLSLIFATLNCVPTLLLIFKNDRSHQVYMSLVVSKISEAVHMLKQKTPSLSATGRDNDTKINRILHALLGETYSINPKVPSFKFSTVLHEPAESYHSETHKVAQTESSKLTTKAIETEENLDLLTEERKLYGSSLFILFVYLMFAIGSTQSPSLAFLNIWALILLDGIHLSMSKGDTDWSPGFKVVLLVLGRVFICGSPQSLWILNYSACYTIYSITLIYEMINSYLPKLSRRKAGEMVFGGGDYQSAIRESLKTHDISGGPGFCLGLLTLCFLGVLVVSAFLPNSGTDESVLDVPSLTVLGMHGWRIYIFGIIAFLVTLIAGLGMATARAFELEHHGLLRGWAREAYLFRRQIKLPFVLAISTEFSILLSGMLLYSITKANAILVGCIFLPAIFFCLGYCLKIWVKNDYDLIKWPRPKGEDTSSFWALATASTLTSMQNFSSSMKKTMLIHGNKEDGGDLEMAFDMMENLTQAEANAKTPQNALIEVDLEEEEPESQLDSSSPEIKKDGNREGDRILKGFTLPPLKPMGNTDKDGAVKEIKMPPLPLKSVLRRKRQNMTIKMPEANNSSNNNSNNVPLIADLRGRDNAKEKDQFGNKNDVIDLDDPWAQFEANEEVGLISGQSKRQRDATSFKAKELNGSSKKKNTSWIRQIRIFLKKNKYFQQISQLFQQASSYLSGSKIYPSKYQVKLDEGKKADDEDEGDEDDDLENNKVISLQERRRGMDSDEEDENEDVEESESEGKKKNNSSSIAVIKVKKSKNGEENEKDNTLTTVPTFEEDYELDESEIAKLDFWDAFWRGYLNPKESAILYTWFLALALIMLFGISLSAVCAPLILGFIVWISLWLVLFFGIPIYKYFQIYQFDPTSILLMKFGFFVHILFCLTFLFDSLYSTEYSVLDSIWVLDFLIYFPIFLYIIFNTIKWFDSGFKLAVIDANEDGQISFGEALKFLQTFPSIMVMMVMLNWQLYLWINLVVGLLFTLSMIIAGIAYLYIKDWARNDYFLSPELRLLANIIINLTIFLSFATAVFRSANPIFPISVFIFAIAFKYVMKIIARLSVLEKGTLFYYSPYVLPVYSYHTLNQDICDESELAKNCLVVLLLGVIWGALLTIFYSPINIGVTLACGFLLFLASIGALCSSYIPRELAKSNALLTPENIIETANFAKEKFQERREPVNFEMRDFQMDVPPEILEDDADKIQNTKTIYQKLIEKTCFENSIAIMADLRSLKYVKEDRTKITEAREAVEEEDEYELPWYQQMVKEAVKAGKDFMRNLYELLPVNHHHGWKKHGQAPFTVKDMGVELFFTGRGSFGFLGVEGQLLRMLKSFKGMGQFEWLYPKWTEQYDEFGNDKRLVPLADYIDYPSILTRVTEIDKALDFTYKEETRCAIHFLLMLLISADSKLQREQVLFQKFLRENRFRLASNGITPPRDIFSSTSYASINIPLVAIWLSTLSKDEQDRFHLLKNAFNLEQKERDELIDQSDYEELMKSQDVKKQRLFHHVQYMQHISLEIKEIRFNKIQQFQDSLNGYEKNKFLLKKELWVNDLNCFVELKDTELYEKFRSQCLNVLDEYSTYAQNYIHDCETAQRDIHTGEYGRNYQFVDSEFPPNETSLGDNEATSLVLGWRCAPGIVENIDLFEGGTHPDDICEGVYSDTWLLSAVSMILAAGQLGHGYINEQIRRIFITHPSINDGEQTYETEVGVYGIQLYRNSEWIPILIDDLLPMRRKEQWTNENRGMACAHLRECRGLWLPLIEKAYAKYYGSYSNIIQGYVHHALEDLTGCEAECIPLSVYSRGINKANLWDRLLKYKGNGYILGAGTGSSEFVDKEILDMGINFNTSYTVYDVIQVDHHQLVKLRNPPGDHESWKGDWSANSPLWTKRLKHKCNYYGNTEITVSDSGNVGDEAAPSYRYHDHNTFYMSFDDFLNIFRFLYVCKYYNPTKWHETKLNGLWKQSNEAMIEQMELMHQFFADAAKDEANIDGDDGVQKKEKFESNEELMNRKKVYAQLNSSGGLPSKHNPNCQLENNPYYSLTIYRPTDLKISVTQYEGKFEQSVELTGKKGNNKQMIENAVIPFAIYVIRNPHGTIPHRLTTIEKDDIIFSTGDAQYEKTLHLYASNILPGDYLVLVAPYLSGMEGKFRLSVLSNYRCECQPIWPPAWMLRDGDIFSSTPLDEERLEDQMKRNFVRGSNAAKKNMKKVSDLFRKGLSRLLGASSPFDVDEEGDAGDESDEDAPKGRAGGGGIEDEMVAVNDV